MACFLALMTEVAGEVLIDRIRQQFGGTDDILFDQLRELSSVDRLYVHRYLAFLAE